MADKKSEGLILRVDLDPDLTKLFIRLKEERNFRTNAEAIRYCLTEVIEQKELTIPAEMALEIDRLIHNSRILQKYQIYDKQEFIKRALETFILKIRRDSGTLFTWSVRQKLNENENAIAVALIELQPQSHPDGVLLTEIIEKTQLPLKTVEEILIDFNDRGLVYEYQRGDKVYYYAPSPEDYEL